MHFHTQNAQMTKTFQAEAISTDCKWICAHIHFWRFVDRNGNFDHELTPHSPLNEIACRQVQIGFACTSYSKTDANVNEEMQKNERVRDGLLIKLNSPIFLTLQTFRAQLHVCFWTPSNSQIASKLSILWWYEDLLHRTMQLRYLQWNRLRFNDQRFLCAASIYLLSINQIFVVLRGLTHSRSPLYIPNKFNVTC